MKHLFSGGIFINILRFRKPRVSTLGTASHEGTRPERALEKTVKYASTFVQKSTAPEMPFGGLRPFPIQNPKIALLAVP